VIAMLDLGLGNLQSVRNAFRHVGVEAVETADPATVAAARALILPGVGAFGNGMASLREKGLVGPVLEHAAQGKPLLGICLGLQLLAELGEEHGLHEGLGLIPGRVVRIRPRDPDCRIPNIGWSPVHILDRGGVFRDIPDGADFYFVHAYHLECPDPALVSAAIDYGGQAVTAGVRKGNIHGVQFHPEKSQDNGLTLIANFARLAGAGAGTP
jgi:glutamine amidotransferase